MLVVLVVLVVLVGQVQVQQVLVVLVVVVFVVVKLVDVKFVVKLVNVQGNQFEIVIVIGICCFIQSVIDCKCNVFIVQDSIVVEDIDQFFDKNVGEVLLCIIGVQLLCEFGEGL